MVRITTRIIPIPSNEAVLVDFKVINEGDEAVTLLKWWTPLEGLKTDCLIVTVDGQIVDYDGKFYKRSTPSASSFVTIPAGEIASVRINLAEAYAITPGKKVAVAFDNSRLRYLVSGVRHSELNKTRVGLMADLSETSLVVTTQPTLTVGQLHRLEADAGLEEIKLIGAKTVDGVPRDPRIVGDLASREVTIVSNAHFNGYKLILRAIRELKDDAYYTRWFGEFDEGRFEVVRRNFVKMKNRFESATFSYVPFGEGCDPDDYAWTTLGSAKIYFCRKFWTAPPRGIASKAGTVVHEHTHATCETGDKTYGRHDCRALARDNPAQAIKTADNYEFYAETVE